MMDRLEKTGWLLIRSKSKTEEEVSASALEISSKLGSLAQGRGNTPVDRLMPREHTEAFVSSLSYQFGLNPFPMHTDTAHRPIPCRFIVLACARDGTRPTPTKLLDSKNLNFSTSEERLTRSAPFLVKNGRRSFYSTIASNSRSFLRVDPGCMIPTNSDGRTILSKYSQEQNEVSIIDHDWSVGDLLIIDNWRMLHGRGSKQEPSSDRLLLRIMIK